MSSRVSGFYKLPLAERRAQLAAQLGLEPQELRAFDPGALGLAAADDMIENVIGVHELPLAVALNLRLDGRDVVVPMAVEEPSIVAAASNAARLTRAGGGFTSSATAPIMIGQIQLTHVDDPEAAVRAIDAARATLLADARARTPRLTARGGGPVDLRSRVLAHAPGPDGGVVVVHVHVDCRDAMGANLVNTLCEELAAPLAAIACGQVGLRILSNLSDERTVTVEVGVPVAALADADHGAAVAEAIAAASRFAEADAYRAATHNKGIMNGVDAVLVATGQDWRAVEAGAHAWAAREGRYRPLATWWIEEGVLRGRLTMPLAVGTVGGALHVHAGARLALRMTGATSASELARIAGAAGLATNLAALRALATEGIQRGHMALHARVVARAAGADGVEVDALAAALARSGDVKLERARALLAQARAARAKSDP